MNKFDRKLAAYQPKKHEPQRPQSYMKQDLYQWRCLCGNDNHVTKLDCCKCGKQRWIQLGMTRESAQDIAYWLTPAYMRRVA